MLDESEYERISRTYEECIRSAKGTRIVPELPVEDVAGIDALFRPVRDLYEELTGWQGMHHNAIMHHRLALYGPPCVACGKPLRTPRASFCVACGARAIAAP